MEAGSSRSSCRCGLSSRTSGGCAHIARAVLWWRGVACDWAAHAIIAWLLLGGKPSTAIPWLSDVSLRADGGWVQLKQRCPIVVWSSHRLQAARRRKRKSVTPDE